MEPKAFQNLPDDTQSKINQVFDWFNANVSRLEAAYKDIGLKFDKVSLELEEKNQKLLHSFMEIESIKTQLKSVLESINSGVIMIQTEGKITLFNTGAEKIYGIRAVSALNKPYKEVMGRKKKNPLHLLDTLKKKVVFNDKQKYWEVDGKMRPIGFTTSIVRDPRGNILGAVEISNDLTQMQQMQNQIQHAKTLAAVGEMAATVSHEIRNPLGAIGGFAGLLERDLDVNDPRRPLAGKIVQGVSSLNKIVSNLLVFSRPMDLQLRQIDFIEWLEEILRYAELEANRLEKKVTFIRDFGMKTLPVHIDPEKFQQVLLNITFNAVQSIENTGEVKIKVVSDSGNFLIISIQDNGKGMNAEELEKIFNPFFTTREQGTGLGLAIVKRIVELHGGSISARSEPGKWAKFEIKLNQQGSFSYG